MGDVLRFWSNAASDTVDCQPDFAFGRSENLQVKKTIAYIVCGILLRGSKEEAEVLLMQEVTGEWYLPAGRLEAGETIENGMKREVKEETGVDCEPLGLIAVETSRPGWFRFTYLAKYSGGTLKTLAERDHESLQALWISSRSLVCGTMAPEMRLRHRDIIRLVQLAVLRYPGDKGDPVCCSRFIERPFNGLFVRLVLVCEKKALLRQNHFPVVEYALCHHLGLVISKYLRSVAEAVFTTTELKVVCAEALPVPSYKHDGACLTVFMEISSRSKTPDGYCWTDIDCDSSLPACIEFWRNHYAVLYI